MSRKFDLLAPDLTRKLTLDLGIGKLDAIAILGNLGHESGGFEKLQEIKPIVPGSRGGYGWAQWTGPRRRAYEAWCKNKGLNPASNEANYGFLIHELKNTPEKAALPRTRVANTLYDKVVAFELGFLRAHPKYKHYDSRHKWALRALAAVDDPQTVREPVAPPDVQAPEPPAKPTERKAPLWLIVLLVMAGILVVSIGVSR
jgi:hypothetical protein